MLDESLISLAVLKVNWDERGRDYVDNFIPFVAEGLRRCPQDHVSVSQLQRVIEESFGLAIPQGALNTLLHRAQRHGYVKRESGVFVRVLDAIPGTYAADRERFARQQRALIEKLVNFCKHRHNVEWSAAEAEEALLSHLQKSNIPILAAAVAGSPVPLPARGVPHAEYLVSSFIVDLDQNDPDGFAFLETVMKGHMLATALFLPDISKANQKFDDLEVFFDTTLLLRALGLEGDGLRQPAIELITLLYRMNVTLSCFDITVDEIRAILEAAQHALRDTRHQHRPHLFAVYEHFLSTGKRASDVELTIARLEQSLRRVHFRIRPKPEHTVELGLNERKLETFIEEEMPLQRLEARHHDVDCLTAIHRLRKGRLYSDIERSRFIFVTPNNALARASAKYFREEYESPAAPLCINDHTLSTLAWVKNPTYAADFSRNRLIADSYVALSPSNELWRKYLDEIARLLEAGNISEQDYQLLRFSMVARNALVDATKGSPDAFTEGTVPEVLEKARANARRDVEGELRLEVERRQAAEREADNFRAREQDRSERLSFIAGEIGQWSGWAVYGLMTVLFVFGFYATLPQFLPDLVDLTRWIIRGVVVLFAAITLWSALEGGNVRALARKTEVAVAKRAETWLVRLLG